MTHVLRLMSLLLSVASLAPVSALAASSEEAARAAAQELAEGLAKVKKPPISAVVIGPFKETGPAAAKMGAPLGEAWAAALKQQAGVKTVDRQILQAVLGEAKVAQIGQGKNPDLGKVAGAQAVLAGEVQDGGSQLVVSARVVSISTGEVIASSRQKVDLAAAPAQAAAAAPSGGAPAAAPPPAEPQPAVSRAGSVESESIEVAMRKLADRIAEGFAKMPGNARYRRLAVLPFNELGEQAQKRQIGSIVAAEIATDLRRDHNLLLVERAQLAEVLKELKLQNFVAEDPSSAGQLGKIADAQALVIGTVSDAGDRYLVNARVIATETGQTLAAESAQVPAAGMVALASDAVVLRSRSGAVFRSILIPGWGQFYNRQSWKGWVFIGTELALAGSAVAFHLLGQDAYNQYTSKDTAAKLGANPTATAADLYDRASRHYQTRNILLGVMGGVWLVNIIDAYASGVDGQSMLAGGVAQTGWMPQPLASAGPEAAALDLRWRW